MLRDHIVRRIGNKHWLRCILSEEDLTYKSAMKIVLALDQQTAKRKNFKVLQGYTKSTSLGNHRDPRDITHFHQYYRVFVVAESTSSRSADLRTWSVTFVIRKDTYPNFAERRQGVNKVNILQLHMVQTHLLNQMK